jgi:SNF2 family DNA or RNA helicase
MTYFRSTARAITEALRKKGHNVFEVSGALDPHKRNEEIKKAIAAESAVLVATMKSTGIGIDLTKFTQAIFAELYYSPEVMEQALGRFSRMSGTLPSNVMLLVMEQTLDERIASRLHDKLEAINLAIKAGATSEQLCSSLGSQENYLNNILAKVDVVTHDEYDF